MTTQTKPINAGTSVPKLNIDVKALRRAKAGAIKQLGRGTEENLSSIKREQALQKAKSWAEKACAISLDTDAESHALLSRIELQMGNGVAALQSALASTEIAPDDARSWYALGHCFLFFKELHRAKEAFLESLDLDPVNAKAGESLAYTLFELGAYPEAFHKYRELSKTRSSNQHFRARLIQASAYVKADVYDPELEQDLLTYLSWEGVDLHQIGGLCSSVLEHKFGLSEKGSGAQFEEMANCPLLLCALRRTLIKSGLLEKLIMALRHEVLSFSTQKGQLIRKYLPLCESISFYGINNEFILPMSEAESHIVNTLENIIDSSLLQVGCSPTDISGALMLYSMYRHWKQLSQFSTLKSFSDDSWSDSTRLLKHEHIDSESELTTQFPSLSATAYSSESIKNQYEEYPYPRWKTLNLMHPVNYGSALQKEFPDYDIPRPLFDSDLAVLVAGCGTGRHAIHIAKGFNNVKLLALDLSHASLSYAQARAEQYGCNNIDFKQADLTQCDLPKDTFGMAECSGVLHHIPEADKALTNILNALKPGGFLKLSLYSQYARRDINKLRDLFLSSTTRLTADQMKMIRQVILDSMPGINTRHIIRSEDFYSLSGTKDLLFHEYEKPVNCLEIQAMLDHHQLKFVGFSGLQYSVKESFKAFHGASYNLQDLRQWHLFEQQNPDTFNAMYQFYCHYLPKPKSI